MIAASLQSGFRCPRRWRNVLTAALSAASVLLALAQPARADCGDSIDGERVPCRCGDVVVADTRLEPDDPVVTDVCEADGLLVRAPAQARSIVVDLNGQAIDGSGVGIGIHVLHGGSDGAVIAGGVAGTPAVVSGFGEGVRSMRPDELRSLTDVVVRESRGAGVVVRGNRAAIESVRLEANGGDGIRTSGRSVDLVDVESEGNGRRGVRDDARGGQRGIKSTANGALDASRGLAPR